MAQTAAQKKAAAAAKEKAANQKMLADAQALLAKQKATLAALEKSQADAKTAATKQAAEDRLERIRAERVFTQSGNNPDNPAPTEAPAAGYRWANYGGVWKQYLIQPGNTGYVAPAGSGSGGGGGGGNTATTKSEISDSTRDAFAMLTNLFATYGLEGLAGEISGYMTSGLTASEALIKLKTNPSGAYATRFAGNFARVKNGLNAVSEAEYINLEDSYANTLKAYGLGNMVSVKRDENYKTFANYIANDISATEFKDRIDTVVTRVQNSDPSVKATLKSFYPTITDNDLVTYFLNPKENLSKLQEKVTASEIGAAATGAGAGITTNLTTATDLAKYGITQKVAREGYSTIASILPTSNKLGDIYNESKIKYGQAEGEAEVFKGNQDAATKRNRLASMERGTFGGSAGRLASRSKTAGLI
jgi:hypothetical protein